MSNLLATLYDRTVRPVLPRKIGMFAGVALRQPRLFDATDTFPHHVKRDLVEVTRAGVNYGDRVVVVGGGVGVSAVVTARLVGPSGHVDIYEASADFIPTIRETLRLNAVEDYASVHHAIVAEARDVYGSVGDAETVLPASLPECDVLQLDCEGAELPILRGLDDHPDTVVVETHPRLGASTEDVREVLTNRGYETIDTRPDPVDGDILIARKQRSDHGENHK